ncbi:MAG: restriction endonuclease [Polyangiaceae bacterium]
MPERDLQSEYETLAALDAGTSDDKRLRGHRFEKFLNRLLAHEKLQPRTRYRPSGEEIDGSFYLDGRFFLLEAKWHEKPLPASTIYAFRGKIDGKLLGTLGIFISMSGYSTEAVDALTLGKALNLLLFDRDDVQESIRGPASFTEVLHAKLRAAAEEGVIYLTSAARALGRSGSVDESPAAHAAPATVIVCEGRMDEVVLRTLAERVVGPGHETLRIVSAMGKFSIPHLARNLHDMLPPETHLILVADSDGDVTSTREMLSGAMAGTTNYRIVVPHPRLEAWLGLGDRPRRGRPDMSRLVTAARSIDIETLRRSDPSFDELYRAFSILTSTRGKHGV